MQTSNRNCRAFVENKQRFDASHLFGRWEREARQYVVYSYGHHFPIYAFIDHTWYENKEEYSVSTSRHQSQARPGCETVKVTTNELQTLLGA